MRRLCRLPALDPHPNLNRDDYEQHEQENHYRRSGQFHLRQDYQAPVAIPGYRRSRFHRDAGHDIRFGHRHRQLVVSASRLGFGAQW